LSIHSGRLIASLERRTHITVIAGTTGSPRADAEAATSLARIGCTSDQPAEFDPCDLATETRTRFVTASDADEEVRAAVRAVIDAVRSGTPLDRIAILHASPQPYARVIHDQLAAAGIGYNGASVMKLSQRPAGRVLLQMLALPEGGFRRQDVFAWLAGAPIHHHGRWAPVTAWERLSRAAAVVAGRHDWDHLLAGLAEDREQRAAQSEQNPEEPAWKAERYREEAGRARSLRSFMLELVDNLAQAAAAPRRWGEHAAWAKALLDASLGGPNRRDSWPEAESKAAEKVELALDRLAALDHVEGPVALDVFTRTLELELDNDLGRVGRFGEGVLVGSIAMGVGLDLDLVIVLGLAEGTFPARVRDDSLLPDQERETTNGDLPLRRQRIDREHRQLLAALAGAERHLLGGPRGDLRRSSERIPSRWAVDLASAIAGQRWWSQDLLHAKNGWVDHVASFSAGIHRPGFPATGQEYRLRARAAGPTGDPVIAAGERTVAARRSREFSRFDGNLAGLAIPSPADHVTSATRLERWAKCPYGYLLQVVLGIEEVDRPEDELTIPPMVKGSLVHQVLEQFIKEVIARPPAEQPGPGDAWTGQDRRRLTAITRQVCAEFEAKGLTGRPIFWKRDRPRIEADL
ncbi:MAG: PD-(D/E)XK nuclease family protein, partial [Actinomycetota bacterium]